MTTVPPPGSPDWTPQQAPAPYGPPTYPQPQYGPTPYAQAPSGPPAYGPPAYPLYAQPPGRGVSIGLAVAALVVSLVALAVAVVVAFGTLDAAGGGSTLTGQVPGVSGGALAPAALEAAVRSRIRDDGGDATDMACPVTTSVEQGAVTVCHGTIDGDTYAVVVFFEDTAGHFTLDPL